MVYERAKRSSFMGYIVQSITNNFAPLLFITFENSFGISLSQITLLITIGFIIQLAIDFASAFFVDKIGYKASSLIANLFAFFGLICLGILPGIINPFVGLLISSVLYNIGGGLIEVIVTPLVDACPSKNKERTMGLLHSSYSWGVAGVIAISTLYFNVFGIENWRWLAMAFSVIPLVNALSFIGAAIPPIVDEGTKGLTLKELSKKKIFWVLVLTMICAGASEISVAQWSSAFAEAALGLSKSISDLVGPMLFAVMMGITRTTYPLLLKRFKLDNMIIASSCLCIAAFLTASLSSSPTVGLIGIIVSGIAVAMLWPGTYSSASVGIKGGGTAMFAILALGGDLGASAGPTLVGFVSDSFGGNLKAGLLFAVIFPVILIISMLITKKIKKREL